MRYRLAGLALLLVCLFTVSVCTNPSTSIMGGTSASSIALMPTNALSGTSWTLTQLIVDGKNRDLRADGGISSCNSTCTTSATFDLVAATTMMAHMRFQAISFICISQALRKGPVLA